MEPNPHFVPFFDLNRAKFPKLDIQDMKQVPIISILDMTTQIAPQGVGEDLASAGVADNSIDVVVMTLVLCTVEDQTKYFFSFLLKCFTFLLNIFDNFSCRTLLEVQRVLKPGGKMFYMEHTIAPQVTSFYSF